MRLRNAGHREVIFSSSVIAPPQIEIDGVWYSPMLHAGGNAYWKRLAAGTETDNIPVDVSFEASGRGRLLLNKLDIKSGKHFLRVRLSDGVRHSIGGPEMQFGERISLISNRIAVDIAPIR
jgi:hypothetical protein